MFFIPSAPTKALAAFKHGAATVISQAAGNPAMNLVKIDGLVRCVWIRFINGCDFILKA